MRNPIKNFKKQIYPKGDITQLFGENPSLYARFDLAGHNGIDIVRPHGEVMYAVEDGEIVSVNDEPGGYGKNVRLLGDRKDEDGTYNLWTYAHNSVNLVKQGDKVVEGQPVALMGNTGFVVSGNTPFWKNNPYAGTHVHFGLRKVKKPSRGGWSYPGSTVRITVKNADNGYKGSVDPYFELFEMTDGPNKDLVKTLQLTTISLLNTLLKRFQK